MIDFLPFHDIFHLLQCLQYFLPKFDHSDNLAYGQSRHKIHQMVPDEENLLQSNLLTSRTAIIDLIYEFQILTVLE
jgi:hypothetical protein